MQLVKSSLTCGALLGLLGLCYSLKKLGFSLKEFKRYIRQVLVGTIEKEYMYCNGLEDLIGNTPLIKIKSLSDETGCLILGKAEFLNVGGSSKDRVALSIVNDAEARGDIRPHSGCTLFEGTVGSTGIALAMISRAKGYHCHIVMPDDQAQEKYLLLDSLGATVEKVKPCSIVDKNHFVNVARRRAQEMNALKTSPEDPSGLFCDQFETLSNYNTHYHATGPEIYKQTGGKVDAFVMGAGTGGTLAGVADYLKSKLSHVKIVLADPQGSGLYNKMKFNVLYSPSEKEGTRRRHQVDTIVEGMGQNRMTANIERIFKQGLLDDAVSVTDKEAVEMSRYIIRQDGLFLGSSSAVNLVAAYRTAKMLGPGHTIVTILCDGGLRHLTKFWHILCKLRNILYMAATFESREILLKTKKSFHKFYNASMNDKYSDFTIALKSPQGIKEIRAHRIIVANHSDFLQAAFDNTHFKESSLSRMDLQFEDPKNVIPSIFQFMYTGEITVSPKTLLPYLRAAEQLLCMELIELLQSCLGNLIEAMHDKNQNSSRFIPLNDVLEMLQDALLLDMTDVIKDVIDILAKRIEEAPWTLNLSMLPYSYFKMLLTHPDLVVESEYRLYTLITRYVHSHQRPAKLMSMQSIPSSMTSASRGMSLVGDTLEPFSLSEDPLEPSMGLSTKHIEDLYKLVQFESLQVEELEEIVRLDIVPKKILISGLLGALKIARGHSSARERPVRSIKFHSKIIKEFTFSGQDFDTNGLVYALGIRGKPRFENPQLNGLIQVNMSSVLKGQASTITSRQCISTCTRREIDAFISLDLGPSIAIKVGAYSLMHGSNKDDVNLRNWVLEGSHDGQEWDMIVQHHQDITLQGSFGTGTWLIHDTQQISDARHPALRRVQVGSGAEKYWRWLRIRGLGKYFMQVCGMELYGSVQSDFEL